jgi:glucose/arabinose dehydrogenase
MRLVRYDITGKLSDANSTNLTLGKQYVILSDIPDQNEEHNGGTLRFGPDGMLYVSIGEDGVPCDSQNPSILRGSILRLDVSNLPSQGSGPPTKSLLIPKGNPLSGPDDNSRLTWCYGLRNPFRFDVDFNTGSLYIADVGGSRYEEYNEAKGGENFGWPWYEGPYKHLTCPGSPPSTPVFPVSGYDTQKMNGASILPFTFYRNRLGGTSNFGNNYEGDAFFVEFYHGFVRHLEKSGNTWGPAAPVPGQPNGTDWATGVPWASDATVGPDGAIYFTHLQYGNIDRIRFTPKLPQIIANATAKAGQGFAVRSQRNPGDLILLAIGTIPIPPTALPGFFGRLEIVGIPIFQGIANAAGNLDLILPVPVQAVGVTVHFQCVAVANNDNFLSPAKTVKIVR